MDNPAIVRGLKSFGTPTAQLGALKIQPGVDMNFTLYRENAKLRMEKKQKKECPEFFLHHNLMSGIK